MVTSLGLRFPPFKSLPPSEAFPILCPCLLITIGSSLMAAYCSITQSRGQRGGDDGVPYGQRRPLALPVREFSYGRAPSLRQTCFAPRCVFPLMKRPPQSFLKLGYCASCGAHGLNPGIQNRRMFDQHIQTVVAKQACATLSGSRYCWSIIDCFQGLQRPLWPSSGRECCARWPD